MNRNKSLSADSEQEFRTANKSTEEPSRPSSPMDGTTVLPTFYQKWIEAILPGPLPVEIEATCSECAMCPPQDEKVSDDQLVFDSGSKCCTYSPGLPNFMVGSILMDTTPSLDAGRASLTKRLDMEVGVSPLAVLPPPVYNLIYRHSQDAFGRNIALRCPHLDTALGSCTIWPYREPACLTWFCKHRRGKFGQIFWKYLYNFLTTINKELALWCVLQLDIGSEALEALEIWRNEETDGEHLKTGQVDGKPDEEVANKIWGRWQGRKTAFFAECSSLVADLSFEDVARICGPEVRLSAQMVVQAFNNLHDIEVPAYLKVGRFKVEGVTTDYVRVWSYSRLDPLDLPVSVFRALSFFNGPATTEVLSTVRLELGASLDGSLLRTLLDFGILEKRDK